MSMFYNAKFSFLVVFFLTIITLGSFASQAKSKLTTRNVEEIYSACVANVRQDLEFRYYILGVAQCIEKRDNLRKKIQEKKPQN